MARSIMRAFAMALALVVGIPSPAISQSIGGGGSANLDTLLCATQGSVAVRTAGGWTCQTPGSSGQVLTSGGAGANTSWSTISGTGTVTSVSLALPSILNVTGSPVTTSGTLTATLASQSANTIFAAPNGTAGAPTFRALVNGDLPIVGIANGGTGQGTSSGAFNSLSPITATGDLIIGTGVNTAARLPIGTSGTILASNGATASWTSVAGAGLMTSVGLALPSSVFAVTGSPVTTSGTLTGSFNTQLTNLVFASPNGSTGVPTFRALASADLPTIAIAQGGTGQVTKAAAFNALSPITATGDLIIGNGVNSATNLAIGASGRVLTSNGTTATWVAPTGSIGANLLGVVTAPTYTANTGTATMVGTNKVITPLTSGNLSVTISGYYFRNSGAAAGTGMQIAINYGTGAAPGLGATLTGTKSGGYQEMTLGANTTAASYYPFSVTTFITGLSVGTAYWIDLQQLAIVTAGSFTWGDITTSVHEQ